MPAERHALLSASASHRWLHCPPSVRLGESFPDRGSDYAAEGSDAHSLCEYKLRKLLGMATAYKKLIDEGKIERPKCTITFM